MPRRTRRLSSPKVRGSTTRSTPALERSRRPSNGSRYASVSGSQAMALTVKSRRRAASSGGMSGSPLDVERRGARGRPSTRVRGSETSTSSDLVDGEALADGVHGPEGRRAAPSARSAGRPKTSRSTSFPGRPEQPVAHPAADHEGAAAVFADEARDRVAVSMLIGARLRGTRRRRPRRRVAGRTCASADR